MIPNKFAYFSQGSTYRSNRTNINDNSIVFVEDDASIITRQNIFGVRGVYPGTCTTAAATAAKVATTTPLFPLDTSGKPLPGTTIAIKFSNSNTYKTSGTPLTLNVNSTGDFPIYFNTSEVVSTTSANTTVSGYKNRYAFYIFNGTQWVWLSYGTDTNTTYANYSLGNGYGIQYDDGTTTEIDVAFTSYALSDNGRVSVLFRHDVPANATMDINAKGAKPIYVDTNNPVTNEMKIKGGVIKAGDIATFVYKTTQYDATGTGTTTLNRYVLVGINDDHSKQDRPIEFTNWFSENFGQILEFPTTEETARTLTTEELAAIQDIQTNRYNWESYGIPTVGYWESDAIVYRWVTPFMLGSERSVYCIELKKTNDNKYWLDGVFNDFVFSEDLATVATSGSYNDLTDTPNIPTILTVPVNSTGTGDNIVYILGNGIQYANITTVLDNGGEVILKYGNKIYCLSKRKNNSLTFSSLQGDDDNYSSFDIDSASRVRYHSGTIITSETTLSKGTTTGSGNAVTDISVSGHQITLTKGETFLTASDITGKADKSAAIGSLSLSLNTTDYKITLTGTYVDGTPFTVSDVIDLPLESVVVSGSYDPSTKKVVLTLKNNSTVEFSIADLISGLQSEITSNNKLSADLIEDGTTNKIYTAADKTKLDGIATGAEVNVQANWTETDTNSDAYIQNKPTIPTVNNGTLTIKQSGITAGTFTANQSSNTTVNIYSTMFGIKGQSGFERDTYNSSNGTWSGVEIVTPDPLVTYIDISNNKLYRYNPLTANYVELSGGGSSITSTAITDLTDIL